MMSSIVKRFAAILAFSVAMMGQAFADGPSRADAQAQVAAAVAHVKKVGVDQAIKDFNTAPEWKVKSMNVIFDTMKGVVLASSLNERLVGKDTFEMKDPSGKEFVKEMAATAQKGEGWVNYQFINPETKKLEERAMFVRKVPSYDGFIGVAVSK